MEIKVNCYAGYRGDQTPRSIHFSDQHIEIEKILDQWLSPDFRYFKCQGKDGTVYIIRHDACSWKWELHSFHKTEAVITI